MLMFESVRIFLILSFFYALERNCAVLKICKPIIYVEIPSDVTRMNTATEIHYAFHGRLVSLRRTGRTSVDDVTVRDDCHRPRATHCGV